MIHYRPHKGEMIEHIHYLKQNNVKILPYKSKPLYMIIWFTISNKEFANLYSYQQGNYHLTNDMIQNILNILDHLYRAM